MSIDFIKKAKFVFLDFDGVIKDSVVVKSDVFENLFLHFNINIAKKVRSHHENNIGMSRFEKIPIYLKYADQKVSEELTKSYEKKFSNIVVQKVIDSQWVNGIQDYLKKNYKKQKFFLITSTPQKEIEEIIYKLNIFQYFEMVIGSPTNKDKALKILINDYDLNSKDAIMIGDSIIDYEAAVKNKVTFILRETSLNKELQSNLSCIKIKNFMEI